MRTSTSQFEIMVEYMERHGDLSKPSSGPHGRLSTIAKWEELAEALNIDPTGCPRTVEKWKKVWSDFKNNTKRKAAKVMRSVEGTGGGPACRLVLTDLEQRVLSLVGVQAASGLPGVAEPGLNEPFLEVQPAAQEQQVEVEIEELVQQHPAPAGSVPTQETTHSPQRTVPTRESAQSPPAQPTPRSHRRRRRRHHDFSASPATPSLPRRRVLRATRRPETAADRFVQADEAWRGMVTEFARAFNANRQRELELQTQWQSLFARGLDILERYFDPGT